MVDRFVSVGDDFKLPAAVLGPLNATYAAVYGVPPGLGDGTVDATAGIQSVIDSAATFGAQVYFPAGTYKVTSPLENFHHVHLAAGAKITAGAPGMAAVARTRESSRFDGGRIYGPGIIDANTNAALGLHLRYFLNFEVTAQIRGGNVGAIKIGSSTAGGRSAEAHVRNTYFRNEGNVVAGSRAIIVENSGDHAYGFIEVQNYEGIADTQPGCNGNWLAVHGWAEPAKGVMKIGWRERANNNHFVACHADTPSEAGWRVSGYQNTWTASGTYLNPAVAGVADGVPVGIKFDAADMIATINSHYFLGGGAGKRFKTEIETIDGKMGLIQTNGCSTQHVVTSVILYNRSIGAIVRDTVTAGLGFSADATVPTGNLGLSIKTGGLDRWKVVSDGGAETGANAGSGFAIRRYSDAGALLSEPIFISRSSGTIVLKSAVSVTDGNNLVFGSTAGSQIGTNAAQKLAFYGLPPVVQPTGTPADATDLATALALVNNLKAKLKTLGLIV